MERKQKRSGGLIFVIFGLLLVAAALALIMYNIWDSERAYKASMEILDEMDQMDTDDGKTLAPAPRKNRSQEVDERVGDTGPSYFEQAKMPTVNIDGYEYIGTLEIPSLGLRLPVMDTWDYDRLKISPCRFSGSYFADDLVIAGHNYQCHFSPVKNIDIGADIYFVTVDHVVYHYTVSNRETVQPTSVDQMIKNQNNTMISGELEQWDLTLFTCNTGGQTRCAVRCIRSDS